MQTPLVGDLKLRAPSHLSSRLPARLMYLRPGILAFFGGLLQRQRGAHAGQLDQHRQIGAGKHFYVTIIHGRNGQVGRRAAEHVGDNDDAVAGVDFA